MQPLSNYIYLYHLNLYWFIPMYPDDISDSMGSTFSRTDALSRSAPVFTYSSSGPRNVTISLSLHRDMMREYAKADGRSLDRSKFYRMGGVQNQIAMPLGGYDSFFPAEFEGTPSSLSEDYIDSLVRALQATALPNYNSYNQNSKVVVPPMVAVRLGNEIFIKGVITSEITVNKKKPIMADGKYSTINLQFTVSEVDPYTANQVEQQGSFRGYVRGDIR